MVDRQARRATTNIKLKGGRGQKAEAIEHRLLSECALQLEERRPHREIFSLGLDFLTVYSKKLLLKVLVTVVTQ
jgi:hypothetical protein